jgi:hypothetical protein
MAKIVRPGQDVKAFGANAQSTERSIFGDGTTQSDLIDDNLNANYLRGWGVIPSGAKPPIQYFNGAMFTVSQMQAYLFQTGVAEYDPLQEYNIGSIANIAGVLYVSQIDLNIGNDPLTDTVSWENLLSLYASIATVSSIWLLLQE